MTGNFSQPWVNHRIFVRLRSNGFPDMTLTAEILVIDLFHRLCQGKDFLSIEDLVVAFKQLCNAGPV